jgi:hypothetical protein
MASPSPSVLDFDKAPFWVRMFNLRTFSVHGKGNWLSDWGSSVGMVEEVDVDEEGVGWGEFLRVQILLDVTKPLSRGRMITLKQKVLWVAFQYEKMLLLWGN